MQHREMRVPLPQEVTYRIRYLITLLKVEEQSCTIFTIRTMSSTVRMFPVSKIADAVGTPFYLYSNHTLENHFTVFDSAFKGIDHLTCFSVKANSNLAVLKLIINLGGGVDIVSGGELFRALKAGVDPRKVVFSGVGKQVHELEYALETGILMFNVESSQELDCP